MLDNEVKVRTKLTGWNNRDINDWTKSSIGKHETDSMHFIWKRSSDESNVSHKSKAHHGI